MLLNINDFLKNRANFQLIKYKNKNLIFYIILPSYVVSELLRLYLQPT